VFNNTSPVLDLYGTDHDPRIWSEPEAFSAERFRRPEDDPFRFIRQGGGNHFQNHRCPGGWITIEVMKVALALPGGRLALSQPEIADHCRTYHFFFGRKSAGRAAVAYAARVISRQ
jgi:fatty-acid peroxygenase